MISMLEITYQRTLKVIRIISDIPQTHNHNHTVSVLFPPLK